MDVGFSLSVAETMCLLDLIRNEPPFQLVLDLLFLLRSLDVTILRVWSRKNTCPCGWRL